MFTNDLLELGTPAAYARTIAARRLRTVVLAAAFAALVTAAALLTFGPPLPTATLTAVALGVAAATAKATAGPWHKVRAGIRAETRVARRLRRCPVAAVVHGAVVGNSGDADHVALGPCAALVETKHARGRVKVRGGRIVAVGRRKLPRDPVEQARRQASAVSRRLGVHVTPVVCLVDMAGRPFDVDGVVVCSASQLRKVLARLPHVVDPRAARGLAQRLHDA